MEIKQSTKQPFISCYASNNHTEVVLDGESTKELITLLCPGTKFLCVAITDKHIYYCEEHVRVTVDEFMSVDEYAETDEYLEQTYEVFVQDDENQWYEAREGDYIEAYEEAFNELIEFKPMIKKLIKDRG